jgi:hypothetical protein
MSFGTETNATVEVDRHVVSSAGITLCPNDFPSALAALAACSYTVTWSELAPFWIADNPLERAKSR